MEIQLLSIPLKILLLFSWKHYREFVIAILDQLESLDGKEIIPSERIAAKQKLNDLYTDLQSHQELKRIEKK